MAYLNNYGATQCWPEDYSSTRIRKCQGARLIEEVKEKGEKGEKGERPNNLF